MSLTSTALRSLRWSMLAEIASKAIAPLVFIILAQVLVPEDFGVVAAATVVTSFSLVFWDAGLSKALIQKSERIEESANTVFWLNLALALALFGLLLACAESIASFFHDPRIAQVVMVLGIQLPIAAFASVHTALLQRAFDFKKLFWIRLTTTLLPALASVPLAYSGAGYWALVAGTLTGQLAQAIVLSLVSSWRPTLSFDKALGADLWRFGRWAMLSALLGWFYGWMDAIIVGRYLGSHDMGLYRVGNTFVILLFGLFFTPLMPVLYSFFSRIRNDIGRVRQHLMFVANGIALISLPLAAVLWTLRGVIEQSLFSGSWVGIGIVIGIMGISHGFAWIVGAGGEAYRAIGKPYVETSILASTLAVYFVGYIVSIQFGLVVFLITRMALAIGSLYPHAWASRHLLQVQPVAWLKILAKSFAISLVILMSLAFLPSLLGRSVVSLAAVGALTAIAYMLTVFLIEPEFIRRTMSMLRGKEAT